MDGCLYAYPRADWMERFQARVGGLDPLSREGRKLQRHFFSGAAEAEVDKQGRIMIPVPLLRYAALQRDVVVAGVHDHLEIWDRETWRRELNEVEGSAEHVAERLAAQRD
jgi:MraZ protein